MHCILDTDNIQTDDRNELILYISHDIIIYRQSNKIILGSCDGEILTEVKSPADCSAYEYLDLGDAVLFVFNGFGLTLFDKTGMEPESYLLDKTKIGRCLTKIYPANNNSVVFGTQQKDRIQFINYDFIQQLRVSQTAFWKVSSITDMIVTEDMTLYAVLDQSTIVACDINTGETLWTRFETAKINKGIVVFNGDLMYTCQGLIKRVTPEGIETIRVPLVEANSIQHEDGRHLYITSNQGKNLCCYHMPSHKLRWELLGRKFIHESVTAQDTKKNSLLLTRSDDFVAIANLSAAKAESSIRTKNIRRLRKTEDHIVIQKITNSTTIIPGVQQNVEAL